jgi:coenzyme F420 biosynthesis associated uncharacterized protein
VDLIDWGAAQRVGELLAGSPPPGGVRTSEVEPLAQEFARRVSTYSGLPAPTELPPLEAVDRPAWIAANLQTMKPLLAPLAERAGEQAGPLAGSLRTATGMMLGAQVGALTGLLSQRVLGQYDLSLLDADVQPRLLLLAPNLAQAAGTLGVDREELVLWVSIHEITHAVQFSGTSWLRDHLSGMLRELMAGLQVTLGPGASPRRLRLPDADDLRGMLARARGGELLRLTLGEDRWRIVERMQSTMSLIEGHAEHTMDAVGAEFLPSLPRLRSAMNRRRESRGLPWRVLERLLGIELKLRQYEAGRRFCDQVVVAGGPEALARVWVRPEALPSSEELVDPQRWLVRTAAAGELPAGSAGG